MELDAKIDRVRDHLLSGRPISKLEALRLYHLDALSQTIGRLKRRGMNIVNVKRDGGYGVYELAGKPIDDFIKENFPGA